MCPTRECTNISKNSLAGCLFALCHCSEKAIRRVQVSACLLWQMHCFQCLCMALINIHPVDVVLHCSALQSCIIRCSKEPSVWASNHTTIRPHHGSCGQISAGSGTFRLGWPSPHISWVKSCSDASLFDMSNTEVKHCGVSPAQRMESLIQHGGDKQHPASGGAVQPLICGRVLPASEIRWDWDCESL